MENLNSHATSESQSGKEKPCRTCVDFKTWMKDKRKHVKPTTGGESSEPTSQSQSESHSVSQPNTQSSSNSTRIPSIDNAEPSRQRHDCPVDKDELGRGTWGLLHTMGAHYPDKPTQVDKERITTFISSFSYLYPCHYCAKDFRKEIKKDPVCTDNGTCLSQWLCKMHNIVNLKLGKPTFDCSKVNERWRDGWSDGSCD